MNRMLSSRERMLIALASKEPDYVPCSFMIFTTLESRCRNQFEFIEKQMELGLDAKVELPELPIRFDPEVRVKTWKETTKEGILLHKVYCTPGGELSVVVRKTEDWPYDEAIPLFNDYLTPRSQKYIVSTPEDLGSVRYLFAEPRRDDICEFRRKARKLRRIAEAKGLLLSGGWRSDGPELGMDRDAGVMGADALLWLCGVERTLLWAMDKPEIIRELLQIISHWTQTRMKIYLEEEIDLLTRRAWYESADLWSPALYRKFMLPVLKQEVNLAHQAGAKFGYIMTSGVMPLLDDLLEAGIDALIGVDPIQGKGTDLYTLKSRVHGRICLWGGVNGFLTIERGTTKRVEEAVDKAISFLKPGGGFILSPVDNVTEGQAAIWNNVDTMIRTWNEMRFYG